MHLDSMPWMLSALLSGYQDSITDIRVMFGDATKLGILQPTIFLAVIFNYFAVGTIQVTQYFLSEIYKGFNHFFQYHIYK